MKATIYVENVRATGNYNEPEIILESERDKIIARDTDELLDNRDWVSATLANAYDLLDMYKAFTDRGMQDNIYSYLKKEARESAEDDFDERWFCTQIEI